MLTEVTPVSRHAEVPWKKPGSLLFTGWGPGRDMELAEQYKRRAAECVRMADQTDQPEDKTMLLQMAQTWLRLAEKLEDRGEQT